LAVLDPAVDLVIDIFPCEDGHAQERSLLPEVLKTVAAGDLWLEDRNFCTTGFLFGIHEKNAAFLVRQHANALRWELVGERQSLGSTERGKVSEQAARLWNEQGQEVQARRITIELDQPTRDGETELHLLTNLPQEAADGLLLARLYLQRWRIETAFAELTVPLACEIKSLAFRRQRSLLSRQPWSVTTPSKCSRRRLQPSTNPHPLLLLPLLRQAFRSARCATSCRCTTSLTRFPACGAAST
jgi:hypothetical protein